MLILNKDKENLLVEKYGFVKKQALDFSVYYDFGKALTIYSVNYKSKSCEVRFASMSRMAQDIVYDLIKDDVLIKVPSESKQEKIEKLQNKIKDLEERIKNIERS